MTERRDAVVPAALLAVALIVSFGSWWVATGVLDERRQLLLVAVESELTAALGNVSQLVDERARDIRGDLLVAGELVARGGQDATITAHFESLARAARHYLGLWLVDAGQVSVAVANERRPAVHLDDELVLRTAQRASEDPGQVVSTPVTSGNYGVVRLVGLSVDAETPAVVSLVSLDSVFDSLQRRARLPGTEVWVVDRDGTALVDPGSEKWRGDIQAHLTSTLNEGTAVLGELPAITPMSAAGADSDLLAWRRGTGRAFGWTTGLVAPLSSVSTELQRTAVTVFFGFFAGTVVLFGVFGVALWYGREKRRLRELVVHLSTVDRLREQLIRSEKLSTFGEIAAGVAHEIGTPLGAIAIRIDQLREADIDPDHERVLDVMRDQIERITRIVRQLLDYARPSEPERQPVDLHEAVLRVATLLEHRLRRGGLSFTHAVAPGTTISADVDQLHQVLLNLLVNACDACSSGDRIEIAAGPGDEGRAVVIEVRDTGEGMDGATRERAFEPFVTTKAPGSGTGLGLAIVQTIVSDHGGSVELASGGAGTTVRVRWPTDAAAILRDDRSNKVEGAA